MSGWPSGLRRQTQAWKASLRGVFWSTNVGVGSNPTSDKDFLIRRVQILSKMDWIKMTWALGATLPSSANEFNCISKRSGRSLPFAHLTSKWDEFNIPFCKPMEDRGIDPRASRMRIERSTTWARPPMPFADLFVIRFVTFQFFRIKSRSNLLWE